MFKCLGVACLASHYISIQQTKNVAAIVVSTNSKPVGVLKNLFFKFIERKQITKEEFTGIDHIEVDKNGHISIDIFRFHRSDLRPLVDMARKLAENPSEFTSHYNVKVSLKAFENKEVLADFYADLVHIGHPWLFFQWLKRLLAGPGGPN